MKKKKYVVFFVSLFIIGGLLFGVLYIPEKSCDSMTDLDEISDYIGDQVATYYDNRDAIDDARLKQVVENVSAITVYPEKNEVEVALKECTFGNKQLFRREIINSKYVKFVEGYVVND